MEEEVHWRKEKKTFKGLNGKVHPLPPEPVPFLKLFRNKDSAEISFTEIISQKKLFSVPTLLGSIFINLLQ